MDGVVVLPVAPAYLTASHQYPHFWRVVSVVRCMMDSSGSAQRAVIQFLRTSLQQSLCTVGVQASVRESKDCENGCLTDPAVSTLKPYSPFLSVSMSMVLFHMNCI
ncbi:hypothetical protein AVEN_38369-1 [Araneus ventricosus]|uniref:Uncharacterized protein n=1 Tax=Araneus ventricosus TaxID=182803 RepID=A0A4Y2J630_ARAVE|nr:hypothetical protein AVEN_38369-1 [Araneus ventricosus]